MGIRIATLGKGSVYNNPEAPPTMTEEDKLKAAEVQGVEPGTAIDPTAIQTFNDLLQRYGAATGQQIENITPETISALAGSPRGDIAGLAMAAQNFAKGYSGVLQQKAAEEAAQVKAIEDEKKRVFEVVRPVIDSVKTNEGAQDEKARAEAISNIKEILKNPEDFKNINLADVMRSYFVQAYKPQYKRLAENGDIKDVASLVAGFLKEGPGKKFNDFISGLQGKGQFGEEDAKEILKMLKPLESQGKKHYDKILEPYINLLKTQGIEDYENYFEKLDWGEDSEELIEKYAAKTKKGGKTEKTQPVRKINSAGYEVVLDGDEWVYPEDYKGGDVNAE